MSIQIKKPVYLHEVGKRANNEDAIYPRAGKSSTYDRLFVVCDGVGGANKGEIASAMVSKLFHQYFLETPTIEVDEKYVTGALRYVEARLTEHSKANPECRGMATTITLLYLDDFRNRATVAWVGDSRIYQMRSGNIIFESEDHSLVNELVKRGEITEEEALVHPQRNVILRAITGSENPVEIETIQINNVKTNDYFLLCTDGILESVENRILKTLLKSDHEELPSVRNKIKSLCEDNSRDNYSMYLVQTLEVIENTADLTDEIGKTEVFENLPSPNAGSDFVGTRAIAKPPITTMDLERSSRRNWLYSLATLFVIALLMVGFFVWKNIGKSQNTYEQYLIEADGLRDNGKLDAAFNLYKQLYIKYPKKTELQNRLYLVGQEKQELRVLKDSLVIIVKSQIQQLNEGANDSFQLAELDSNFQQIVPELSINRLSDLSLQLKDSIEQRYVRGLEDEEDLPKNSILDSLNVNKDSLQLDNDFRKLQNNLLDSTKVISEEEDNKIEADVEVEPKKTEQLDTSISNAEKRANIEALKEEQRNKREEDSLEIKKEIKKN